MVVVFATHIFPAKISVQLPYLMISFKDVSYKDICFENNWALNMWAATRKTNSAFKHAQKAHSDHPVHAQFHPGLCSPFIFSKVYNYSTSRQLRP